MGLSEIALVSDEHNFYLFEQTPVKKCGRTRKLAKLCQNRVWWIIRHIFGMSTVRKFNTFNTTKNYNPIVFLLPWIGCSMYIILVTDRPKAYRAGWPTNRKKSAVQPKPDRICVSCPCRDGNKTDTMERNYNTDNDDTAWH